MIYVGYQGIGKSSISGRNNCIDLESCNFWIDGKRDENWYIIYCNIAQHLSEQGYNVFLSSHKVLRDELNRRNVEFVCIYPKLSLKNDWIIKLKDRYDRTKLTKDYKALMNAIDQFENNINDLKQEKNTIEIDSIDYDLTKVIFSKARTSQSDEQTYDRVRS